MKAQTNFMYVHFKPEHRADKELAKKEYKRLSKEYHPDKNRSPLASVIMAQINGEYERLLDVLANPLKYPDEVTFKKEGPNKEPDPMQDFYDEYNNGQPFEDPGSTYYKNGGRRSGGFGYADNTYNQKREGKPVNEDLEIYEREMCTSILFGIKDSRAFTNMPEHNKARYLIFQYVCKLLENSITLRKAHFTHLANTIGHSTVPNADEKLWNAYLTI